MKFGDVVICVSAWAVILTLIFAPIEIGFVSALGPAVERGPNIALVVSFLISAVIVGYIFANKIRESRVESIAKILVVAAAFFISLLFNTPSFGDWNQMVKEAYLTSHPGVMLTASEWVGVEDMALAQRLSINTTLTLIIGFIGLFIGSKLRK